MEWHSFHSNNMENTMRAMFCCVKPMQAWIDNWNVWTVHKLIGLHVLQRKETKKIIILHRACYGKCKYTHERFAITKDSKWCFYAYLLDYVLLAKWRINKMCAVCIFRLIEIWMRPFTGFCSFSLSIALPLSLLWHLMASGYWTVLMRNDICHFTQHELAWNV